MSTNGAIARPVEGGGWEGRYHHQDSYPSGLGSVLFDLAQPDAYFGGDLFAMLRFLLDEHPGGWSTLCGYKNVMPDFTQATGWYDPFGIPNTASTDRYKVPAICYCHGDRSISNLMLSSFNDYDWQYYTYVLNPLTGMMAVYEERGFVSWVDLTGPKPDFLIVN